MGINILLSLKITLSEDVSQTVSSPVFLSHYPVDAFSHHILSRQLLFAFVLALSAAQDTSGALLFRYSRVAE